MTGILPKDNDYSPSLNPLDRWLLQDDDEKSKPGPNNNAKYHAAQEASQSLDTLDSLYLSPDDPNSLFKVVTTFQKSLGPLRPELLDPPTPVSVSVPYSDPREQDIHAQIDAISVGEFQFGDTNDTTQTQGLSSLSELQPTATTEKTKTPLGSVQYITDDDTTLPPGTKGIFEFIGEQCASTKLTNTPLKKGAMKAPFLLVSFGMNLKENENSENAIRDATIDTAVESIAHHLIPKAAVYSAKLAKAGISGATGLATEGIMLMSDVCQLVDSGTPSLQEIGEAIHHGTQIKYVKPRKWLKIKMKLASWVAIAETTHSATSFVADNTKKALNFVQPKLSEPFNDDNSDCYVIKPPGFFGALHGARIICPPSGSLSKKGAEEKEPFRLVGIKDSTTV